MGTKPEIDLEVITMCNEKCPYCISQHLPVNKYFNPKLLQTLDDIDFNDYHKINILGGEPGLLKLEDFKIIHEYLNNRDIVDTRISICTNGLFLDKYGHLYPNFDYNYHIISKEKLKIYNSSFDIDYNYIVSTEYDLDELKDIALNNPDTLFFVVIDEFKKEFSDEFVEKYKNLILYIDNIEYHEFHNDKLEKIFLSSLYDKRIFRMYNILSLLQNKKIVKYISLY